MNNKLRIYLGRFFPQIDPVFQQSKELVDRTQNYSVAHLQRQYRLGYSRAKRIMAKIKLINNVPKEFSGVIRSPRVSRG